MGGLFCVKKKGKRMIEYKYFIQIKKEVAWYMGSVDDIIPVISFTTQPIAAGAGINPYAVIPVITIKTYSGGEGMTNYGDECDFTYQETQDIEVLKYNLKDIKEELVKAIASDNVKLQRILQPVYTELLE